MIAAGRVALEAKTAGRVTLETLMRAALLTKAGRTSIYDEGGAHKHLWRRSCPQRNEV
jgi:hypothetical protein